MRSSCLGTLSCLTGAELHCLGSLEVIVAGADHCLEDWVSGADLYHHG